MFLEDLMWGNLWLMETKCCWSCRYFYEKYYRPRVCHKIRHASIHGLRCIPCYYTSWDEKRSEKSSQENRVLMELWIDFATGSQTIIKQENAITLFLLMVWKCFNFLSFYLLIFLCTPKYFSKNVFGKTNRNVAYTGYMPNV